MRADRVVGIDAWRGALVLIGPVIHATVFQPNTAFTLAMPLSNAFRMGVFFMFSGLLAARSLGARPGRAWLRHRLVQIGVPTLVAVLVLVPLDRCAIGWAARARSEEARTIFAFDHSWFLVSLVIYAPLAPMLRSRAGRRLVGMLEDRSGAAGVQLLFMLATGAAVFALMTLGGAVAALVPTDARFSLDMMPEMIGYAPLYLAGCLFAQSDRLRRRLVHPAGAPAALAAMMLGAMVATLLALALFDTAAAPAWSLVREVVRVLGPAAAAPLACRSALAIRTVAPWLRRLSDASFTIYLLHYPALAGLRALVPQAPTSGASALADYLWLLGWSLAASWLFHVAVVRRSRWAAFLLNGRPIAYEPAPAGAQLAAA